MQGKFRANDTNKKAQTNSVMEACLSDRPGECDLKESRVSELEVESGFPLCLGKCIFVQWTKAVSGCLSKYSETSALCNSKSAKSQCLSLKSAMNYSLVSVFLQSEASVYSEHVLVCPSTLTLVKHTQKLWGILIWGIEGEICLLDTVVMAKVFTIDYCMNKLQWDNCSTK